MLNSSGSVSTVRDRMQTLTLLVMKGLHVVGLALLLGEIAYSHSINIHIEAADLAALANGRQIVSLVSHRLIMSGLALMVVTGIAMALVRYGLRWPRWVLVKTACAILFAVIAFSFVFPAVVNATAWAVRSAQDHQRYAEYAFWLGRETSFGTATLLLLIISGVLALWKPRLLKKADALSS